MTFVTPQLLNLEEYDFFSDGNKDLHLLTFSLCNCALALGFNAGTNRRAENEYSTVFKSEKSLKTVIWIFFAIGSVASLMNRGAYKGGFVSGTFVIISFFAAFATVALLLILIGFNRKLLTGKIYIVIAVFIVALSIDKIIASGRRAETINLVLMILYFYMDRQKSVYKWLRVLVPLFFFAGFMFGGQVGKYRENAYAGDKSFWENISSLDFSSDNENGKLEKGEIYNAFIGMQNVGQYNSYDYGAYNWNGIIKDFIPTALVSKGFKQSLMIQNSSRATVEYLTRSGSTMTGYYDAFLSFGIFGFIKFQLIGFMMGWLWIRRNESDIALLFYFSLLTPGLHLLTHSSNYFVSQLIFQLLFVYLVLKFISVKVSSEESGKSITGIN